MFKVNYKFCPACGGNLDYSKFGNKAPICSKCGYVFYQNSRPTAGAIISDDSGRVLLTRRALDPAKGKLQNPGGFLELGEDPITGLKREIKEEVGVEIEVGELIGMWIGQYIDDERAGEYATLNLFYEAKIKSGEPKPLDETTEIFWLGKDEIDWENLAFDNTRKVLKAYFEKHMRP